MRLVPRHLTSVTSVTYDADSIITRNAAPGVCRQHNLPRRYRICGSCDFAHSITLMYSHCESCDSPAHKKDRIPGSGPFILLIRPPLSEFILSMAQRSVAMWLSGPSPCGSAVCRHVAQRSSAARMYFFSKYLSSGFAVASRPHTACSTSFGRRRLPYQ